MAEALADRLAEAFAEKLHEIVRKDEWGYAPDEHLTPEDLLKVKYQGTGPTACWHACSVLLGPALLGALLFTSDLCRIGR